MRISEFGGMISAIGRFPRAQKRHSAKILDRDGRAG
jgi:hypothetical protein